MALNVPASPMFESQHPEPR